MINKPLIAGVVGFLLGGLLVSIAATTFDKPTTTNPSTDMSQMTESLKNVKGDEYDKKFISDMIDHHQAAIDMAKLSAAQAKHQEIKDLSKAIISAQSQEIDMMQTWQTEWGYKNTPRSHDMHNM